MARYAKLLFVLVLSPLTCSPVIAGNLAIGYGHLPIQEWTKIGRRDRTRISREVAKEDKLNDPIFLDSCVMTMAKDRRFKRQLIEFGLVSCAEFAKRQQTKKK